MIVRLTLGCALLLASRAVAQGWTAEAAAGRALHDPVAARVATTSASLGLGYQGTGRWLYLSAGVPVQGSGPTWSAGGLGGWLPFSTIQGVDLGLNASVNGYAYGASGPNAGGTGGTAELLPTLGWRRGVLSASLSSGISAATDVTGDSSTTRGFHDSAGRLAFALSDGIEVGGDARLLRGEGGDWPYAGGTAELRRAWGGAWAHAGSWLGGHHPRPAASYGAGVRVRVMAGASLQASVRQEPFDPLLWSTPRRTWNLQVSRALGRQRQPRPALLPEVVFGEAVFRLPRKDHAEPPAVVGDFSGWQPVPMVVDGEWWVARVRIAPGVHHFSYRLADGQMMLPPGVPSVDDGFGGRSAVVVVP
ncbi:glycogen-binding domain-containing protein [Longimicrobium sp.]|uniref:glycogen-binding domain-containing protein n=1 Tax=Longimicrobium sp. TaxID=2029185 RepID=UPI002ED9FC4D